MSASHCIEVCNGLLRGERSAVETYDKAIEAFGEKPVPLELKEMRSDHANSVMALEENVRSMGGTPDRDAGVWGALANTVQGAASALGVVTSLESLETGEMAGKKDYQKALEDDEVMSECKQLIRSTLLPRVSEHIHTLELLQKAA